MIDIGLVTIMIGKFIELIDRAPYVDNTTLTHSTTSGLLQKVATTRKPFQLKNDKSIITVCCTVLYRLPQQTVLLDSRRTLDL